MTVEHYTSGRIVIDGRAYTSDVIVWPEGVDDTWWRAEGHYLTREDLEPILNKDPDVIIVGSGAQGNMEVPDEVRDYMEEQCSELHVEPTERACSLYNELAGGTRRVVAALHLTC